MLLFLIIGITVFARDSKIEMSSTKLEEIDKFIIKNQKKWKTPGVAVAIINGEDEVKFRNYGYSNKKNSMEITEHSLFEIASTSKAFTGLGLLLLVQEGKIPLTEPVTTYIPWLKLTHDDKEVVPTVGDFLYHKTGIPYGFVANIPVDEKTGAIERAVRTLVGAEVEFIPGSRFQYATVNYDVLGLVIEKVSGMAFEDYIREEVLLPLGLNETFSNMENAKNTGNMATGYKMSLLACREYEAPYYRGQVPAGYIVSSSSDISRWLQIQLGLIDVPEKLRRAIEQSQVPDQSIAASFGGSFYAAGWNIVHESNGFISHGGANPNFSTFYGFSPSNKTGIAVLANMNSDSTAHMANGVLDILNIKKPAVLPGDQYKQVDTVSSILLLVCSLLFFSHICLFDKHHNRDNNQKEEIYWICCKPDN